MKLKVFILLAVLLVLPSIANAEVVAPRSSELIWETFSRISVTSSDTIVLTGYTRTFFAVDSVKVTTYLQHWNGSSWKDITTYNVLNEPPSTERYA